MRIFFFQAEDGIRVDRAWFGSQRAAGRGEAPSPGSRTRTWQGGSPGLAPAHHTGDTGASSRDARHWPRHRGRRTGAEDPEEPAVAKVTMPQLGESVAEGTSGKWL